MRLTILGAIALCAFPAGCESGAGGEFGQVLGEVLDGIEGSPSSGGELTLAEIDAGLRQALEIGTERVAAQIGVVDGYWKDPQIQIPLPGRLGQVQGELAKLGLSGPLDDVQLRMNRAAEQAVPAGKTIVIDAVQSITIEDALGILRGGDTAATDFLRGRTEASLRQTFTPFVENALDSSGAYPALSPVTTSHTSSHLAAIHSTTDIPTYLAQFSLSRMFNLLAVEV